MGLRKRDRRATRLIFVVFLLGLGGNQSIYRRLRLLELFWAMLMFNQRLLD